MCRAGQIQEAYALAKEDWENNPNNVWEQRKIGWALCYTIQQDARNGRYDQIIAHIDELQSLDLLDILNDRILFDNVIFWIGYYARRLSPTHIDTPAQLSTLFAKVRVYTFMPSQGYSTLLEGFIKFSEWQELLEFIEWWDLNNLRLDDYQPVQLQNRRTMMSIAERAYIAMSKALIRKNDPGKIEEFLPQMDNLVTNHPEMTYPGYFYGKLLLTLGSTPQDALRVIIPFARRKTTEFWVWQLLSDIFINDPDKQLACLLRAVHCRTQEHFLGKVRIKLAEIFLRRNELPLAKYQINKVVQCYLAQGWRLPNEIEMWIHQEWIHSITESDYIPIDYQTITDEILLDGAEEAIGVVTYYDKKKQRANIVYGYKMRMVERIRFSVGLGTILKLHYTTESNGRNRVLSARKAPFPQNLNYAQVVQGSIKKRDEWAYAFLRHGNETAFIAPNIVNTYHVNDGENVQCLIVYDYDRKQNTWNWCVISINR